MNFIKFDTNAQSLLDVYLSGSRYTGSDFSYQAFLCWFEDLEYAVHDDALFIRAFFNGELRYWTPVIKPGSKLTAKEAAAMLPEGSAFAYATEEFVKEMGDGYVACTNRNWSEYIYDVKEFLSLSGNKYSGKRNHIARFKKLYNSEMRPFSKEDYEDFIAFEGSWVDAHKFGERLNESAKKEYKIAMGWLGAVLRGELICDVLRVDGNIAGVSIGEKLSSGNAVIIFEKADRKYEGVYSYIAHEFVARNFSDCKYINRQEDMGIEGLRKSKMSYNPAFILDKYVLTPAVRCDKDEEGSFIKPCEGDSSLEEGDGECFEILSREDMLIDTLENEKSKFDLKIEEIRNAPLDNYIFRKLEPLDFNSVMTFFKCGIRNLEDKKFFMNYTDEELLEVLQTGYILGAFYDNHLVATCAFDTDKHFGDKLKDICRDSGNSQYYEFSGIMVCKYHRGKGLGRSICKKVIDYVKQNYDRITLCATVQINNTASLNNLLGLNFHEVAEAKYKEYTFKYLTYEI